MQGDAVTLEECGLVGERQSNTLDLRPTIAAVWHAGEAELRGDAVPSRSFGTEIAKRAKLLLADKDLLARGLTIKLLTYATGASPPDADGPQTDALVAKVREKDYGFRSLIHEIVASELFRSK